MALFEKKKFKTNRKKVYLCRFTLYLISRVVPYYFKRYIHYQIFNKQQKHN